MPNLEDLPEEPPKTKYKLILKIDGNTHEEIESELAYFKNGGYLLDSEYHKRDSFKVFGGRKSAELIHQNPDMTTEKYADELSSWWERRKAKKRED